MTDTGPAPRLPKKEEVFRKGRAFAHRVLDFGQRKVNAGFSLASAVLPEGPVGGICGMTARLPFTPDEILIAYAQGMFPMDKRGSVGWYHPDPRCVLPLDQLHVPSRIKTYLRKGLFELCFDRDSSGVLAACGDRKDTWLTPRVQEAYQRLFEMGAMHTVEAWNEGRLVGGMFGVAMGRIYTVESMFSHENHASKLAFAFAAQQLGEAGYQLIDCQFQQDHFERFGAIELPRSEYRRIVARGHVDPPRFPRQAVAPQKPKQAPKAKAQNPPGKRKNDKGQKKPTEKANGPGNGGRVTGAEGADGGS